jgi:hypothetical protein
MTGLNHAITGAVVAAAIKKPELALPAAFLSHFATDAIPHWNYRLPHIRIKHVVMLADLTLSLLLLLLLAMSAYHVSGWLVFSGGLLAIAPDFMWLQFFLTGQPAKMNKKTPLHLTRRFHLKIQWSETDKGIWFELVWFGLMLLAIYYLL